MSSRRLRPSGLTWVLLGTAVVSATWAHLDARSPDAPRATLVSTRSAAWRLLPEIANTDVAGAAIELRAPNAVPVRLVPDGLGHRVMAGDEVLGPADPEAMEGIWDSLRLATTLRAVDEGAAVELGSGGRIVIELPQGGTRTLVLGPEAADGAGRYGAIEGGVEGTEGQWVLETELSVLVEQPAETWLARRAVVVEPAELAALREGDLRVSRGIDGLWRARVGEGPASLLDRVAVETRLDRLVSARLDPLVDPRDDPGSPWITLEGLDGADTTLDRHGPCPGRDGRVLIDRGPGRWGCIDEALVAPWPVPGRGGSEAGALLDPRLAPHAYGRVLRVELREPAPRVLRRYGGAWRIEEDHDGRTTVFDVDEPEVFRWYDALHDAEVSLDEDDGAPFSPTVDLTLVTDSTATLRLRCTDEEPRRCRRDDGPVLRLRQRIPPLAFDVDTFAERRLTALPSEDARALEILPGADEEAVVRQSMQLDLGVWRLDAPMHPAGDAALDELRLEALLGTLGALRAEAWVDAPEGGPLRRLRIERVPRGGADPVLEIELYEGCVARVEGQRPARLSEGACETLGRDLLVELPIERAVVIARGLELTRDGRTVRLSPRGESWTDEDGGPASEANAWLRGWMDRPAPSLRGGRPPSPVEWTLRVLPREGTAFVFEGGPGWLGLEGASWWYAVPQEEGSMPSEEPSDEAPTPDEPSEDPPG